MGKRYFYEVDYHCTCEVCGVRFTGVMRRGPLEYGSSILPSQMAAAVTAADMVLSRKLIQSSVDGTGSQSYIAANAEHCPHCGARQSWYPVVEPKKSHGFGLVLFMGFLGAMLGILLWAIFLIDVDAAGPWFMGAGIALGVVPSAMLAWKDRTPNKGSYQEQKKAYEEFSESMKTRTVREKPVIDWTTARRNPID